MLVISDPLAAVDIYCKFPIPDEPTFDDAYIFGEIVRLLMKAENFDDPRLAPNMISLGKIMGIGGEDFSRSKGFVKLRDVHSSICFLQVIWRNMSISWRINSKASYWWLFTLVSMGKMLKTLTCKHSSSSNAGFKLSSIMLSAEDGWWMALLVLLQNELMMQNPLQNAVPNVCCFFVCSNYVLWSQMRTASTMILLVSSWLYSIIVV